MEISKNIIIDKEKKYLFKKILDFKFSSSFFDHISNVENSNDLNYDKIGKEYLEYTKGFFRNEQIIKITLAQCNTFNLIVFKTNHSILKHKIKLEFIEIKKNKTNLTFTFLIQNKFIEPLILIFKPLFYLRIKKALKKMKIFFEK